MEQWYDTDLVAVEWRDINLYRVAALSARCCTCHYSKTFKSEEQAERFILNQYPDHLKVEFEDIEEEIERRKVLNARHAQAAE